MGTLFKNLLPATKKAPTAAAVTTAGDRVRWPGCILLAEDEEVIREMAQIGLESKGYQSVQCGGRRRRALDVPRAPTNIDLVVADMVMPRMSGSDYSRA